MIIKIRDVEETDLPVFFRHHADPDANYMAAFTAKDPTDKKAFDERWARIMGDDLLVKKAVLVDGEVVGNVLRFEYLGLPTIAYWIGKEHWGKGIASAALAEFAKRIDVRPLYGRAAKDNIGSIRVMEKCGFVLVGEEKGFANARGKEIDEVILRLD